MFVSTNRLLPSLVVALLWLQAGVAAASGLPNFDRVRLLDQAPLISDFELTDTDGQSFKLDELRGKVALIFFGFTNCPDVCPTTMARLQQFRNSDFETADQVEYVLISVDGERDTPEVMKAFVTRFSPDFIGLTGEPASVKRLAKAFRAPFYKGNEAGSSHGYSVAHSPAVFVVDQQGRLRAELYNAAFEAIEGINAALLKEAYQD